MWNQVPKSIINTTICSTIEGKAIDGIFKKVDQLKGNNKVNIIIGGPHCQAYPVAGRARMGKKVRNELYKYYVDLSSAMILKCLYSKMHWDYRPLNEVNLFADLKRLVEELAPESNFHDKFDLHKIIVHFATK